MPFYYLVILTDYAIDTDMPALLFHPTFLPMYHSFNILPFGDDTIVFGAFYIRTLFDGGPIDTSGERSS